MFRNYVRLAWRNLKKNKLYSFINIAGLATGMAVAMLIGLWVWDEISFDRSHKNYDRIGQVWQFVKFEKEKASYNSVPVPIAEEFRLKYPEIKSASVATYNRTVVLGTTDKKISGTGMFVEPAFPEIMTFKMMKGRTTGGLADIHSILLSESLAKVFFGNEDPIDRIIRIDNKADVTVTGIFEDLPSNSTFKDVKFLSPWQLFTSIDEYAKRASTEWDENSFQLFVQLNEGADFAKTSNAIRDMRMQRDNPPPYKPEFFIHPMNRWHLHGEFKDGQNAGGLIQLVKMFGIAGVFVLLLACINFMNLSTARSEKRAKEVGIRKTIGSARSQLIGQFFSESLLVSFLALLLCLGLVQLSLPFFNDIAGKSISIPWDNPLFWLMAAGFCILTGLIAGSYPALYLSSFRPIKVLKGTFRAGRMASLPRKVLVVFQFTVSVVLIIGTIVVFRQIQHAKDRPSGYNKNGLIEIAMTTPDLAKNYRALEADLFRTGHISSIAQASVPVTADYGGTTNVLWKGRSGDSRPLFMMNRITREFGKTIGWKIGKGRDFSADFMTDSSAVILNNAAVEVMGLKDPLSETVRINGKEYRVIGVSENVVKFSPYDRVQPSLFTLDNSPGVVIVVRIAENKGLHTALTGIGSVFKKYNPAAPFEYRFVDEQYAAKFSNELRIGTLAGFFAAFAIFISCLGLFGLASFVAEQRTKEIGMRKVLGASMASVWRILSREFVLLVCIALLIASPVAYYFMHSWLENYTYRVELAWWIFAVAGLLAFVLTILMVSFQTVRAALANPIRSLRTE
jgi:putative ABC transport system permease protein